jgi:hypothetical protein
MHDTTIDNHKQFARRAPDLYLQTCSELKREIAESVKEERQLERNSLLACGAVYTYLSSDKLHTFISSDTVHAFPSVAWYLPCAIAMFGAFRTIVLMISISPRAQYLKKVEELILKDRVPEGWETFFRSHYRFGVGASIFVFWIALIACTLIAPEYFTERQVPTFALAVWDIMKSEHTRILLIAVAIGGGTVAAIEVARRVKGTRKRWRTGFLLSIGITAAVIASLCYVLLMAAIHAN